MDLLLNNQLILLMGQPQALAMGQRLLLPKQAFQEVQVVPKGLQEVQVAPANPQEVQVVPKGLRLLLP